MSFLSGFDDILEVGVRLAGLTTFGIGGPAELVARPQSRARLAELLVAAAREGIAVRVLGAGSNVLVADEGIGGVVVLLAGREFARLEKLPGEVRCGAGLRLARLVREAAATGLSGVEGLAGIPASVGGALRMNAGGRYGSIGDLVIEVEGLDPAGSDVRLTREQAGFGYRSSRLAGTVVTGCRLRLHAEPPAVVRGRTRDVLAEKRSRQPLKESSAGCVFRNPAGGPPAGQLIESLGLKGHRVGGAEVSRLHANYIVNRGGATCADVLEVIDAVRRAARESLGIELDLEIEIWS